ncbi:retron St85 family RNA-directed DNA polymerase [Pseudomonas mendocina]|uniref:retron St85 family RNA-directed DNA polymerase n=1 Tax=Ectopseudomonas mendocina TaxID=300 RepID=UPI0023DC07EF|nr:retron St85 family RNA-directed DNA polymerase [Pseudomonas mendocina]MDF2077078.1 retron St85 family RNA-directed DNA polymerase [Pseudomonas mendocina]
MLNAQDVIREMSIDIGILPGHLREIIKTAPLRYKTFKVPKKNGGERDVAQPAREVKKIQRWMIKKLTPLLPIHDAVTAYRTGFSIKENAAAHAGNNFLLKVDFKDFFPSIIRDDIEKHLGKYCGECYDSTAIALLSYCLCWAPKRMPPLRLCIGAPSSPLISNSILFDFDLAVSCAAKDLGVTYTRYADDISFSTAKRGDLDKMLERIKSIICSVDYPALKINPSKTVFASRKGSKIVTGLILTPDRKLSVGRERKKIARAMYHRLRCGLLSQEEQEQLTGLLAFIESIEPGFRERLQISYNSKSQDQI